jgi:transcriptional antiterminator RfaH
VNSLVDRSTKLDFMKHWYALYTRSRFEKRTYSLLLDKGVDVYLPLIKSWRVWSDRRKQIEVPLMSSYLFVNTDVADYEAHIKILNTPGVVRFISFEGQAVPIPEYQIMALKRLSMEGIDMQCLDVSPPPGTLVTIEMGPLKGLKGEVVYSGNSKKVIIRIDSLDKCITVNIPLIQLGIL